ncbi:Tat (twin-arginine translocation) pathway signal sequence [Haladaptatus litoreus]|uniref:Tat (Twin-arginine translocation) pathway signal sequence n=1 Tax=Haladaptatus litoreus TaxID=553468 RepID=A0A1N6ZSR2_9EURY|nr:PQQ-binding-like beta-propeller repeat protein [Haladaptatus litoreus]SIR29953.1 Tat (twin-arginine translocation) pathway signal sequence [Haladaptatus litoreus]
MSKNTRRTFLKTVGLTVGGVGVAGASARQTDKFAESDESHHCDDATTSDVNWRFGPHSPFRHTPAVGEKTVYAREDGEYLYAIDRETGTERWRFEVTGDDDPAGTVGPVLCDGTVYVAGNSGDDTRLYAVDAATGEERWSFFVSGGVRTTPTVEDGTLYFASFTHSTTYALDTDTGDVQWTFTGDCDPLGHPRDDVLVTAGNAYVVDGNNLWALDADDGGVEWALRPNEFSLYALAVTDDTVYVGLSDGSSCVADGNLVALDAASGTERWSTDVSGLSTADEIEVGGGRVYVVSYVHDPTRLVALNGDDGTEHWSFEVDETGVANTTEQGVIEHSHTVYDGNVYFSANRSVYQLDGDDGSVSARWDAEYPIIEAPAVTEDAVYADSAFDDRTNRYGYVYSFDRDE